MSSIVVYASTGGNTKAVAEYIAKKIGGVAMDVSAVKRADLDSFDTVIIGGRVWAGSIPKNLDAFLTDSKDVIANKKSAFFVCCMYNDEKGQKQCDGLAAKYGIKNHTFFNKGKKLVAEGGSAIDDFIKTF